jgi:hypothetical protein
MAHIMKAHLFGLATEPEATNDAKSLIVRAKSMRLSEREAEEMCLHDVRHGEIGRSLDRAVKQANRIAAVDIEGFDGLVEQCYGF